MTISGLFQVGNLGFLCTDLCSLRPELCSGLVLPFYHYISVILFTGYFQCSWNFSPVDLVFCHLDTPNGQFILSWAVSSLYFSCYSPFPVLPFLH